MKNIRIILVLIIMFFILFGSTSTFADEELVQVETTKSFDEWTQLSDKEKEKNIMPNPINVIGQKNKEDNIIKRVINTILKASFNNSQYSLTEDIDITVKDQGNTNECWAFSATSVLETCISLITNEKSDTYSPRHIDYSTSKTFLENVENENSFSREVGDGGNFFIALAYFTSGKGPILESDMSFKDDENKINISEIQNKTVQKQVDGTAQFPYIFKTYNDGNVQYYSDEEHNNSLNDSQVEEIRNQIKKHIIDYGGVASYTYGLPYNNSNNQKYFYNNSNMSKATAFYCDDTSVIPNHAVTIIGWDDNYSKNNFSSTCKPIHNGAWKCLNSYGDDSFENGYIWISYDDVMIEQNCAGITSATDVDYDNIYQYDYLGSTSAFEIKNSNTQEKLDTAYLGNVYNRDSSKKENLTEIGVYISDYSKLQIYVNPNGELKKVSELVEVYNDSTIFSPGYHVIKLKTPINLTGTKFAVAVKYISASDNNIAYLPVEEAYQGTFWESATGNKGESYYSGYGNDWKDITYRYAVQTSNETRYANACIKAFTTNEEKKITVESNKYIVKNNMITQVPLSTTVDEFKKNIVVTGSNYTIYDEKNNIITSGVMKTGYKLVVNNINYQIAVIYDFNGDGLFNTIDVSKMKLHLSELPKYSLSGIYLEAADINNSSKVDLTDLSILIINYMKLP